MSIWKGLAWAFSHIGKSAEGTPGKTAAHIRANPPSVPPPIPHDAVAIPFVPKPDDATMRFSRCVAEVLRHEGGYVDHPKDPGGATNRGITLTTLADWRGRDVSKVEVQALTEKEAREIYRARYWNAVQGDALPAGVDLALFDFAVNSGPSRAVRTLQWQLGVPADGAIGPVTLAAVRKVNAARLAGDLCRARLAFLRGLPTWDTFGKGWTARVVDVERAALGMVS
jgi:lysozyme family protein